MSQTRPWEHSIGIGLESAFGVAVAPSAWLPGKSTLKKSPGIRELENPVGEWDEARVTTEPTKVGGSLSLEVAPGRESILIAMLTRVTRRTMQPVTVYDVLGDQDAFVNAGVCANTVSFKCASGEDLMADVDVIGRTRGRSAIPIPNFNSAPAPYVFEEMLVGVAGAYEYHLEDVEVSVDHKLKDDKYGSDGTGLLREIPTDGRVVTVKLKHAYEHPELWDAAMARQALAATLLFQRGSSYFGISFPYLLITEGDVEDNEQPLELKALRTTTSEAIVLTRG